MKIATVLGTEKKFGPRLVQPLPRGGALVVLNGFERQQVVAQLQRLDEAVAMAAAILSRQRIRAHRATARALTAERPVLRLVGGDFLLGEIPEPK